MGTTRPGAHHHQNSTVDDQQVEHLKARIRDLESRDQPLPSGLPTAQQMVDLVAVAARSEAYRWEGSAKGKEISTALYGFARKLEDLLK